MSDDDELADKLAASERRVADLQAKLQPRHTLSPKKTYLAVPSSATTENVPAISTARTIVPRHLAAAFDNLAAIILGVCAAKSLPDEYPIAQIMSFVIVYLGYYFAFESLISRTPGKLLAGLVIRRADGRSISTREAVVRTALRVLEVNPALLGALPAAFCIVLSPRNQRLGDMLAGTIVVRYSELQASGFNE